MNGHLVPHMLSNIQYHPCLLAGITLTAKALTAQTSLMNMLDALPEYSFVLEYITANIDQPVEVMGRWTEYGLGSFHCSAKPIDTYNIRKATYNGGVYALTSFENNFQYVGSTYNHYSRLGAHMAQFKQHFGSILDLTDKYQWASVNGGLTEWKWCEIYRTFNFYMNFVQAYPLYPLTYGEYIILVSLSQFLPRILEQSLFDVWHFDWNKKFSVDFSYRSWNPQWLDTHSWGNKAHEVLIRDFETGKVLRSSIPSLSLAKDALGIRNSGWKSRYPKLPLIIDSSTLGRKVIVQKASKTTPFLLDVSY